MTTETAAAPRTGFRALRVTARKPETALVTSFWLEPVEMEGWRDFQAGQFLSFRLPSNDARGKMLRNYSLASAPHEQGRYQICVKRDRPDAGVTAGQGSGYFHEQVQVGSVLYADGPRGNLVLRDSHAPAVLISADIGITPLIAMARALAARQQPMTFIHECEDAGQQIMREEMASLIADTPASRQFSLYRAAGQKLDRTSLRDLLPASVDTVYLCGPTPFMERAYDGLRSAGIAPAQIAHEFFGPIKDLERAWQDNQAAAQSSS